MPETVKYTEEAIGNLLKGKLSCGITDASQVYVNAKVPFAYDYADQDNDVIGDQSHGTHVAGTVAGDCENLQGIAPKAQLLIMKVFADGTGSTNDSLILAGLDDAVKLGADTINMSLGSQAAFPTTGMRPTPAFTILWRRRGSISWLLLATKTALPLIMYLEMTIHWRPSQTRLWLLLPVLIRLPSALLPWKMWHMILLIFWWENSDSPMEM